MRLYARLAAAGSVVLKKAPGADQQILIEKIFLTADATGTLTFSDGTQSFVFDVAAGSPVEFHWGLVFSGSADVTITAATSNITIFAEHTLKHA